MNATPPKKQSLLPAILAPLLAPLAPYGALMRLEKPIGIWLLLFPCWWGLSLAGSVSGQIPDWEMVVAFALGAVVMRGAGCTFNDLIDRDFDAKVARTASRPIPSGAVSLKAAIVFLGLLLLLGLWVLLSFNAHTIYLGVAALPLIVLYPFMKRITYWPQAFLGLTFNWGALLGWSAMEGKLALPAFLLYAGGIFWTLGYDTIYAHQDREDDALAGIKSTARLFGAHSKAWLGFFYAAAILLFALSGLSVNTGFLFYAGLSVAAAHFYWQVKTLDINSGENCLARFKANALIGWIILAAILSGSVKF